MNFVVGSLKRYKLQSTEQAVSLLLPHTVNQVIGADVESGVSSQPMSNEESIEGAMNRAAAALVSSEGEFDIGIGIENGLVAIDGSWFATTWIVAMTADGQSSKAATLLRPVPAKVMTLVEQGQELSEALRTSYGAEGEKGLIDLITRGVLHRQPVLSDGIITAISPLLED